MPRHGHRSPMRHEGPGRCCSQGHPVALRGVPCGLGPRRPRPRRLRHGQGRRPAIELGHPRRGLPSPLGRRASRTHQGVPPRGNSWHRRSMWQ
eukprot:964070-Pyramimonas_sp.AAC.1